MAETQLVIFRLGREEYGIQVTDVQSIITYQEAVKVPNTPAFVEGIINLRGDIVPIIDLKKRFNLPEKEVDSHTRIVVIKVDEKQVGFIVDEASQVLRVASESIEPAPELVVGIDKQYIVGVGKLENRLIIILDLNKVFTNKESQELARI